jgi:hypothetical protein
MRGLLDPSELQGRMELYLRDEESADRLPKRSFGLLREGLFSGELLRGRVPGLIDASERTARHVISALVENACLFPNPIRHPYDLGSQSMLWNGGFQGCTYQQHPLLQPSARRVSHRRIKCWISLICASA